MGSQTSSKTHDLFFQILSTVSQSARQMTVGDLAKALNVAPDVIAHCIALHVYLETKRDAHLSIPPPADYWVPGVDDVITHGALDPQSSGSMPFVEAELQSALVGVKAAMKRVKRGPLPRKVISTP